MKKQILSLILLSSCPAFTNCNEQAVVAAIGAASEGIVTKGHKRKKANFKDLKFIQEVDGKYGLFDGYSVLESFKAISEIHTIQYGKLDKTTNKRNGLYTFQDKLSTLQDLVIEEQKLTKEGVAKDDARWAALNAALTKIKDDFNDKMKKLRGAKEESEIAKNIKHKLITFFLKDQNRETSLMANADLPDEKTRLYAASATEFFSFLNDLKHFLEDMVESCTEAHKQYKEIVQKAHTK